MSSPVNSPLSSARPLSRSSSRGSVRSARASSPSISLKDPAFGHSKSAWFVIFFAVAVRNQMSTLKHSIRQQQAQLHNLENIIQRAPRPFSTSGILAMASSNHVSHPSDEVLDISYPPSAYTTNFSTPKMRRRSSFDVLQGLAGRDSNLPLPRRESATPNLKAEGIPEGIPMEFGGLPTRDSVKRMSSPTRTLSHADMATTSVNPNASTSSLQAPASPSRRISLTPGGTSKVLADLQTGVSNARNALENTKSQLRLSQRTGRERLRLENEGLNNVVARKERLLQEVLERARKAEAEAAALKLQLKTETTSSKRSLREMEAALTESTALSQKSEREYITLRDSIKSMTESWKHDTERLRDEMRKREDKLKKEAESVGKKYTQLAEEMKAAQQEQKKVKELRTEDSKIRKEVEDEFREEIKRLKVHVEQQSHISDEAIETARTLASELARLRRLMQTGARSSPPLYTDSEDSSSVS
ncbi:hypothetical protein BU15DRAFT_87520 [Melanogaster broomeanus]|nr:hypothetical protein BU15DRAFT_87520 [Melanogaster broomeanus]